MSRYSQIPQIAQPLDISVFMVEDQGEFCQQTQGFFYHVSHFSNTYSESLTEECGCLFKQGNVLYYAILHNGAF